jgi:hypothetical protein
MLGLKRTGSSRLPASEKSGRVSRRSETGSAIRSSDGGVDDRAGLHPNRFRLQLREDFLDPTAQPMDGRVEGATSSTRAVSASAPGTWKRSYGLRGMRWIGIAKAAAQVHLTAIAYSKSAARSSGVPSIEALTQFFVGLQWDLAFPGLRKPPIGGG